MKRKAFWKSLRRDRQLVFMLIPVVIFFAVFSYYPLYGILIAFKDYSISRGILGSPWAGLRYFRTVFFQPLFRQTSAQYGSDQRIQPAVGLPDSDSLRAAFERV